MLQDDTLARDCFVAFAPRNDKEAKFNTYLVKCFRTTYFPSVTATW